MQKKQSKMLTLVVSRIRLQGNFPLPLKFTFFKSSLVLIEAHTIPVAYVLLFSLQEYQGKR